MLLAKKLFVARATSDLAWCPEACAYRILNGRMFSPRSRFKIIAFGEIPNGHSSTFSETLGLQGSHDVLTISDSSDDYLLAEEIMTLRGGAHVLALLVSTGHPRLHRALIEKGYVTGSTSEAGIAPGHFRVLSFKD